jgi:DNA polymerase type B, organellar and viral
VKPFIFWDGEGVRQFICYNNGEVEIDFPYCLFGASTGERIKYVNLSTIDCLELIMRVGLKHRGSIHVGFSIGYDINMIIKDLPVRALYLLRKDGKCIYEGYRIEHIPKKWIRISYNGKSVKIFDVFLFFNCKFGEALRKYKIGSDEDLARIDKGKEERPNFTWVDIKEIEQYWETELKYGAQLMEGLRNIIYGADFRITSWHGPGALASYALATNNTCQSMDTNSTPSIISASRYAMFGGRFNAFYAGYYSGPVYERDINSAYAYAFSKLPNLASGKWRYDPFPDRQESAYKRIGLYHIRFLRSNPSFSNPLPHRSRNGSISFPRCVDGWYHAGEAALVKDDPDAEFLEAWLFEDDGSYPFSWVIDAFHERQLMQERSDPCEKTIKWMLAALYGQTAQRVGWQERNGPPKWHQLEWAGAVTAECRSMLYFAAKRAGHSLITMDTDGFISLAPVNILPNGVGSGLGQWKAEEHTGILYLQNGIYWLRDMNGEWQPPKSRGIPRKKLSFDVVYPMMCQNQQLTVSQHMFIGYGLALRGQMDKWRKWVDVPRTITFGGNGKAQHISRNCPACQKGLSWGEAMHALTQIPPQDIESYPYNLPWLNPDNNEANQLKKWAEV